MRLDPTPPLLATLVGALVLAGCSGQTEPSTEWPDEPEPRPAGGSVRLLVAGDTGKQDKLQLETADAMVDACARLGCDAALFLGDNIYDSGPTSLADPQFLTAFEVPYAALQIPVYLVLGNHDVDNGRHPERGDLEVQYSTRDDRPSTMWHMPARHYNLTWGQGLVSLWAIDTTTFADDDGQQEWLSKGIAQSNATWTLVAGHHNYASNGAYGDGAPAFKAALEETACGHADFYLHGHEHDLRWLLPQPSCGATQFIVSGAGAHAERRKLHDHGFPERFSYGTTSGFAWMEFTRDTAHVRFFGQVEGQPRPIYDGTVAASRSS